MDETAKRILTEWVAEYRRRATAAAELVATTTLAPTTAYFNIGKERAYAKVADELEAAIRLIEAE